MSTKQNKYLPFLMWLFPLSFFTYQFIWRLWPSLTMQQMMEQFSIDASHFGLYAALYYYGYSLMQIPIAILLERYHPRFIIFWFASLCGIAALIFNYTDNWYIACFTRLLVGIGSAVGFLGVSRVVSEWFTKDNYGKMIGFSFSVGLTGAVYGGKPVSLLIERYNWHNVALVLSLFAIIIGCSALLFLRSPKTANNNKLKREPFNFSNFKTLLCSPTIWLLAIANLLMVGSLEGVSDVWGVPYLMTAYGLNKADAAQLISFVFIGMLFGGPLLTIFSKKLGNYPVIILCAIGMAIAFCCLLFNTQFNLWSLSCLFFLVGIMCCYQVLVFAAGSDLVKPELLGVTIALLNCVNMLGGSFFHTSIGRMMDLFWTGILKEDGLRYYTLDSYKAALMLIPICSIVGAIILSFLAVKLKKKVSTQLAWSN